MEAVPSSIAGAMLSSLFDYIFERLFASSEFLNFVRQEQVLSQLNKWQNLLPQFRSILDGAEDKQTVSPAVKLWLSDLQDIVYDAEDITDEIATEALRRRILGVTQMTSTGSKVCRFVPNCVTGLNLSVVKFSARMGSKMEDITVRFEGMVERMNVLNLLGRSDEGRLERIRDGLRSTSSLVDESQVYGREMDKHEIIQRLMNVEIGEIGVVCVVGMGGVGKTTLAQFVYNDEKVENLFELRVWVCVSEDFDVVRLTEILLQSVTKGSCHSKGDLNSLQLRLREELSRKKFLIVLDDVWNENYKRWDVLRRPFLAGTAGSKVLVTTRSERVASIMTTCEVYHLQALSDDACMSLFATHALRASNFDGQANLKGIGGEIVKKCKGLPLATKTLGGLLRGKVNYDEWEDMLRSKIRDIPEERGGIIPDLKLSYHHLPSHLKRCFAYCAIFPKDYEFDKNELVLLWMAEGLIQEAKGEKQAWDLGLAYFHDLLSRSFFQRSNSNETLFVMHDLINDLAQSIAGEICFHFENNCGDKLAGSIEKLRHLSFTRRQYDIFKRFEVFEPAKSLRTFIALPIDTSSSKTACCYLSKDVLQELVAKLRYLRVLCLSGYDIGELPYSIGHLEQLRYLNLSYSTIKQLPESVGSLLNLQTFLLRGCKELTKLPQSIENLINLLVLDLTDTEKLVEMPLRIGNLKNLQILSKFIVGKDNQFGIKELKDLMHLKGEFCIMGLENVVNVRDARLANLVDKQCLDALDLKWSEFFDYQNEEDEMHVLDMLQPHKNLKELRISFYGGKRFPHWLGDPSFTNVVEVKLHNCSVSMSLPSLGKLPSLRTVSIQGMNRVKKVGFEFYGDDFLSTKWFPSLEVLCFQNMLEWECWSSPQETNVDLDDGFPSLCELVIQNCPKLIGNLPSCFPSLVKFIISHCPKLGHSLTSLPSLCELKIEDCNKVRLENIVDLTSLTTLKIQGIRDLSCLPQEMLETLGALQILEISNCTELIYLWQRGFELKNIASLEHLEIKGCSKFVSLVENEQGLPCGVENVELMNSGNLEKLCLKSLQIESCPKFVSFPEIGCLSTLRRIKLKDCAALITLPNWTAMPNYRTTDYLLQVLEIEECPSLTSFPTGILPTKLQRLKIRGCRDLQSLPGGIMQNDDSTNVSHLESLEIDDCPSLTCFPKGRLPFSLKTLKISDCSKLEPLSEQLLQNNASLEYIRMRNCATLKYLPECLHCLAHLTELTISSCPALISFPVIGLPPNLNTLEIDNCVNLKSLPERMKNLASLQYLTVCDCPRLMIFPIGDLPPQLLLLKIWDCINLKEPMSEWNLESLTSLKELNIAGAPNITSFPDENCLLPTSLSLIFIARLNNLESLSSALQNLTSLEELEVVDCPKLRHLPREGLPATLGRLCIRNCKHLKQKCLKKTGDYSTRVAHIPNVEIEW
ncbi:hypothetical protein SLEP1_g2773 [Rubroshorea leprosula]|uniref:Disease resistance RPP13-like protein 1 n=1 Tax=Rubroshorea leprosula TaxID=152421 RepID=A0AAV5HSS3_9ROSI|nr:hypothetical protein SLEP1_g2773 [Rubroshorea leprosula]